MAIMMILEFVFRSLWTYLGTLMLVTVIFGCLASWRPVTIVRRGEE